MIFKKKKMKMKLYYFNFEQSNTNSLLYASTGKLRNQKSTASLTYRLLKSIHFKSVLWTTFSWLVLMVIQLNHHQIKSPEEPPQKWFENEWTLHFAFWLASKKHLFAKNGSAWRFVIFNKHTYAYTASICRD